MVQNHKSEGKCHFCDKIFTKAGINRHLKTHLEKKTSENATEKSFLVKIEQNPHWGSAPYFLSLWVDGNAAMKDIDTFLREIWLECCGHISTFRKPKDMRRVGFGAIFEAMELLEDGKTKLYEKLMEETFGEIPMSRKAGKVLYV